MNKRLDRKKLTIGTYILQPYAQTERHVRDLRDCGIDMVVCMHKEDGREILDLLHKYGIGCVLSGEVPGWWGGDGDNAGKLAQTNPLSKYEDAAAAFEDHPAIWGIDVGDEPSALDFPHYGRVIDTVNRLYPNQFAYLNLYPNYASVAKNNAAETVNQLGTATYAEHIERYIENVPTDYICYDFYLYSAGVARAYENLRIVADACLRTGRAMWIVLQVNSSKPDIWISENELRFQAYSAMAFGAESVIWACWTAGWWHNQVVDENGEKTEQYEKLKTVNAELRALGAVYMRYRRTATHFLGFGDDHPDLKALEQAPADTLDTGVFFDVRADKPLIVGQMVSRDNDGSYALMLSAADDPHDGHHGTVNVCFRVGGGRDVYFCAGGTRTGLFADENGVYHVGLPSCGGGMIVVM